MDPNPFVNPPMGFILFGLAMVLLLAAAVYAVGAWGAAKMRQGRIEDSTGIPYPDQPRSADDRETVRHVEARDAGPERVVTQEQVNELAVGDRKVIPQTPSSEERPVDAAARDKNNHQVNHHAAEGVSPAHEQGLARREGTGGPDPL